MTGSFHFAQPAWLWALLLCLLVALWLILAPRFNTNERIRQYADPHLLPYLLGSSGQDTRTRWRRFARWAVLWVVAVLAMAGPRWDFTDVRLFSPGTNLIVLFDISRSMDVADVQPSRLGRARQELEDILHRSRGIRVGLIAFASVSHVVSPITEDMQGISRVLAALDTSLVSLQGSRLNFALDRAENLIASQPKDSVNSILIITDGDFAEEGLEQRLLGLAGKGVRVHILGVGTPGGDRVPGPRQGLWMVGSNGRPVISRLNEPALRSLAQAGKGVYRRADYRDDDTDAILDKIEASALPASASASDERTRIWHERYYLLAGLALLLLLPWFRMTTTEYPQSEK
jgi:Ca-activated chloride channel family protein